MAVALPSGLGYDLYCDRSMEVDIHGTLSAEEDTFGEILAGVFAKPASEVDPQQLRKKCNCSALEKDMSSQGCVPELTSSDHKLQTSRQKRSNSATSPSGSPYIPTTHEIAEAESEDTRSNDREAGSHRSKAPLEEDEKLKRRKQINRESARRIRARKTQQTEDLRQKVAVKQQHIDNLLHENECLMLENRELVRDKSLLLQRSIELTKRWQHVSAENLELRSSLQMCSPSVNNNGSWGTGVVALEDARSLANPPGMPLFSSPSTHSHSEPHPYLLDMPSHCLPLGINLNSLWDNLVLPNPSTHRTHPTMGSSPHLADPKPGRLL